MHRNAFWLFSLCLVLTACGGGAGDSGIPGTSTTAQSAPKIEGVVLDVDGESDLSANVPLQIVETGEVAVTNTDGAFEFYDVPEGDVTLVLATQGVVSLKSGEDDNEDDESDDDDDTDGEDDEADDDHERRDREVIIRRIRRGDVIRIDIRIRDRQIIDIRLTRTRDDENDRCWKRELEIEMTKTDGNPDEDMEGEVELEVDCEPCQKFEVEVEDATPGDILVAVVIDPDENEEVLGRREVEADGDAEWRLDTCDGDELPFGYERITGLGKHVVCVRTEDGRNLLKARIPAFPTHDDPPNDRCVSLRARAKLRSAVDRVEGYVELRIRGCVDEGFRQIFKIEAEHLDAGQEVEFFLEDPDDPGQLVSIGTVLANADGEAELEFDTGDGDELPFGVETLRELVGMAIEVNDDVTGDLLLAGHVPGLLRD